MLGVEADLSSEGAEDGTVVDAEGVERVAETEGEEGESGGGTAAAVGGEGLVYGLYGEGGSCEAT